LIRSMSSSTRSPGLEKRVSSRCRFPLWVGPALVGLIEVRTRHRAACRVGAEVASVPGGELAAVTLSYASHYEHLSGAAKECLGEIPLLRGGRTTRIWMTRAVSVVGPPRYAVSASRTPHRIVASALKLPRPTPHKLVKRKRMQSQPRNARRLGAPFTLTGVELRAAPQTWLVAYRRSLICHTDFAFQHGTSVPIAGVLGHEGSGTVVSVGADVTTVSVASGSRSAFTMRRLPPVLEGPTAYGHGFLE